MAVLDGWLWICFFCNHSETANHVKVQPLLITSFVWNRYFRALFYLFKGGISIINFLVPHLRYIKKFRLQVQRFGLRWWETICREFAKISELNVYRKILQQPYLQHISLYLNVLAVFKLYVQYKIKATGIAETYYLKVS